MALPTSWPMVTVSGTYLRVDGTPNEGSVWFETAQRVVVTDANGLVIGVVPRRIIADLDENGHFSIDLPCTDAGASPTGWTWQVYERFNGGQAAYSIDVPQALQNQGINLAQYPHAVPVLVAPPTASYLTTADIGVTVADQVAVNNAVTTANAAATTANNAQTDATNAVTTANNASAVANGIDAKAQTALDNSNAAVTTANDASTTANGIAGTANTALDNANAAVTTANNAQTDATNAVNTANGIAGTANTALTNSNNAVTTANAAQATANAALPATSNAVSASKWATPRTLSLTGPVTGSAAVDGSADAPIATTITDKSIGLGKIDPTGSVAGQVLQSTGPAGALAWGWPQNAFKNKLINGNFDIWQRGTSSNVAAAAAAYLADRFNNQSMGGTTAVVSQQAFPVGQTDVPNGPTYFVRHVVTSVAGAGNGYRMQQKIEGVQPLANVWLTVSFWARADVARNIGVQLTQVFGSGGSANVEMNGLVCAVGTSWTKCSVTFVTPSVAGATLGPGDALVLQIWMDAGSNYAAQSANIGQQSGTFDIAQVQVEVGKAATPFEMRPIGLELALCQRYFEKSYGTDTAPGFVTMAGSDRINITGLSASAHGVNIPSMYKVTKRVAPTVVIYSPSTGAAAKAYDLTAGADTNAIVDTALVGMRSHTIATNGVANASLDIRVHWTADAEL